MFEVLQREKYNGKTMSTKIEKNTSVTISPYNNDRRKKLSGRLHKIFDMLKVMLREKTKSSKKTMHPGSHSLPQSNQC